MADAAYARIQTEPRVNPAAEVLLGTIVSISDGDTVKIRTIDAKTKTLRLEGIDAPESGQPYGTRAKEQLGSWIFQKEVRAEVSELDRYGRYLADIYVDGRWANHAMVRTGLAWHYVEYSNDQHLAEAESLAREEAAGIWTTRDYVAPWDWRRGEHGRSDLAGRAPPSDRASTGIASGLAPITPPSFGQESPPDSSVPMEAEETVYITKTGAKYHRGGCQYLRKSMIPISLSKVQARYAPCSRCKP